MWLFLLSNLGMGGSSGSTPVPPIAFNLNAWAAVLASSDSDPLAVDPYGAVLVSSDSDPLAVDPSQAAIVN
jgi:hypothetical protein